MGATGHRELVDTLVRRLQARGWKMATAESCTGGLLGAALTDLPGSSAWFDCGFVTYSNLSKQKLLGVSEALLTQWGAVSAPVAEAMVVGALERSQADIAVSVTGVAGPEGGSREKPVGTVWFGWGLGGAAVGSSTARFDGNRQAVRDQAVRHALRLLLPLVE